MQKAPIEYFDPKQLVSYTRNARIHGEKQIKQIANSIATFGFLNPVLIDENYTIMAGHGRVAASIELAIDKIPVRKITHLNEDEKRAYI